jgi:hypothetical protein
VSDHYFDQVLVTDTEQERLQQIFTSVDSELRIFRVESGVVQPVVTELKTEQL